MFNMTNSSLTKVGDHLDHGDFTAPFFPPQTIIPDQLAEWRGESAGDVPIIGSILTGTEGTVDYQVDGRSDRVHFGWVNPAVGNTFFDFPGPRDANGPSDFVFFPIHFGTDGSVEPPPGQDNPVVSVTQGGLGDENGISTVLPLPFQDRLFEHAWFEVGLRNKQDPVSVKRWLKALGIDPSQGLRAIGLKRFSVRQLLELPFLPGGGVA